MNKIIQITNIIQGGKRKNPQRGRIYSAQGCSPCLNGIGGRRFRTEVLMDKAKIKLRYALGRTNKPNEWSGKSGTANFHVNPVFACVTSTQWSNRGALIVEIKWNSYINFRTATIGGAYFKYSPTVNSSAWSANNLLICLEPNGEKIYSRQAQKRAGQTDTPTI